MVIQVRALPRRQAAPVAAPMALPWAPTSSPAMAEAPVPLARRRRYRPPLGLGGGLKVTRASAATFRPGRPSKAVGDLGDGPRAWRNVGSCRRNPPARMKTFTCATHIYMCWQDVKRAECQSAHPDGVGKLSARFGLAELHVVHPANRIVQPCPKQMQTTRTTKTTNHIRLAANATSGITSILQQAIR